MGERIKGSGTKKMLLALGCFLLYYFVAGEVAAAIALLANLDATMALMAGRALAALIFFLALGGRRYLRLDWHAINRGISSNRIFIIFNTLICVGYTGFRIYQALRAGTPTDFDAAGTALRLIRLFALAAMVGINEELAMRGLVFGGLLARFGEERGGVFACAIIASLVFGAIHLLPELGSINSGPALLQAATKTLETAMFALCMCAAMLKTANIVGPIITHTLYDWLLFAATAGVSGGSATTNYVSASAEASYASSIVFIVMCFVFLPTTMRAARDLLELDMPQRGPFMD